MELKIGPLPPLLPGRREEVGGGRWESRRLEAPELVDIRSSVLIRRMTLLEELQLPALRSVEGITSQCNPRLHISVLEHIIEALEVPSALLACGVPGAPDCVLAVDELTC